MQDGENEKVPEKVTVNLGGKVRVLKFPTSRLMDIEANFQHRSVMALASEPSLSFLVMAVLFGLKTDDETLNLNKVQRWVDQAFKDGLTYQTFTRTVLKALENAGAFRNDKAEMAGEAKEANPDPNA